MRALPTNLRKELETAVLGARRAGESACRAALDMLGVFAERRPEHLDAGRALLRNGLRAKWRQLGGDRGLLVAECAYEQWHRLLFARFLAENNLLLHPQHNAPVTLADCDDLAAELGEPDGWSVAARFAAEILPGIFRLDDPCVLLRLTPEGRYELEQILVGLPREVFAADDALGWVYQFWQKDMKDEVNNSERKIGGADLGPVTQLFTENYMVRFLLENSLGAWWAARHPGSPLVKDFEYLRFDSDGKPSAGSFEGWPDRAAEVTVVDPCCGSGHFLVEAFSLLWRMRSEEDGLEAIDAQDAVLSDNLFGLEIDPRCVQIAMFAMALHAWKVGGGWRQIPSPNIACSGIPVKALVDEWTKLGNGDVRLERALTKLYLLFREADTLGSLIDARRFTEITSPVGFQRSLDDIDWSDLAPVLDGLLQRESVDPARMVLGLDARSIAVAARYLSKQYTLVATNVPYLAKASQGDLLRQFTEHRYSTADRDLATVFLERLREFRVPHGSLAGVFPQNWLSLTTYESFRRELLTHDRWDMLVRLGSGAFDGISGEVVNVCLLVATETCPPQSHAIVGLDLSAVPRPANKARASIETELVRVSQLAQLTNKDSRFSFEDLSHGALLAEYANSYQGLKTGDNPRFVRAFWEVASLGDVWRRIQSPVDISREWSGCSQIVYWQENGATLKRSVQARVQGADAWGRWGVLVREVKPFPATIYNGSIFESSGIAIVPNQPEDLSAIWEFCRSPDFYIAIRRIDQKLSVATATVTQVPFDIDYWREVAATAGPLSEPWSADPKQWLFGGRPEESLSALQVATARLVGYRWPEQSASDDLDLLADADGIACLPPVAGELSAADRVEQLLASAFEGAWSPATAIRLLEEIGSRKKNLADWLREEFFKQHCAVFNNRPFVWHIWDGLPDGFATLINYHRLDRKLLEKLTYTYLGQDWVERQRAAVRDDVPGAETRLSAALALQRKLEAILEGEKPYDIYVRWKEVHKQPIGWEPDLNDGVRLNIRPFVEAGVLRSPFNIHWRKDRGKNPDGSERHNDVHLSLAEKREARHRVRRA
jgi:hypothetical protein